MVINPLKNPNSAESIRGGERSACAAKTIHLGLKVLKNKWHLIGN